MRHLGLEVSFGDHFCNRVRYRECFLYREVHRDVECIRNSTRVASYGPYHRYSRNCGLNGIITSMFSICVVGGLSTTFVTRIGVGVKRYGALEVWGALGGRPMFCKISINCFGTMKGGTSYNATSTKAGRGTITFNVVCGVPRGWRVLGVTRYLGNFGLVTWTDTCFATIVKRPLFGTLITRLYRVIGNYVTLERDGFKGIGLTRFGLRVTRVHGFLYVLGNLKGVKRGLIRFLL